MTNFSSEIIVWAFWKSPGNCFYLFPSMSKTRWKLGDFLKVKISRISNLSKHRLAYTHFKGLDELMKMQPIIFKNIHNYAKLCIIMQNMQVFSFLSKHRFVYTHFKGLNELMKMQPIIFQNIHNYAKLCKIMQNMQVFYFYQNIALCILILKHSLSWLLCPNTVTERGAVNNPCGFVPDR